MKIPVKFNQFESALDPFVNAAGTSALISACDLLFIHGNDLTWGQPQQGFFLADVDADENFEEVVQVVEGRVKMRFNRIATNLISALQPKMMQMAAEVASVATDRLADNPDADEREILGAAIGAKFSQSTVKAEFEQTLLGIFGPNQLPLLTDAIASWLVRSAHMLRQRQMAVTGMTEDRYRAMLYALRRFNLCEPIVRVAYPEDSFHFELSLSSQGAFKTAEVLDNAKLVEVLRLRSPLSRLKSGRDNALAVFIANYINRNYLGQREAFACAEYGEKDKPEFDVVIPALKAGFEVKLYQAPFAQTENKLENLARDLRNQLPAYLHIGCEHIFYVSNLSQGAAEVVLKKAFGDNKTGLNVRLIAGDIDALLPVLNEMVGALEYTRDSNLHREMEGRIAASVKKTKKPPTKSKKETRRKGTRK